MSYTRVFAKLRKWCVLRARDLGLNTGDVLPSTSLFMRPALEFFSDFARNFYFMLIKLVYVLWDRDWALLCRELRFVPYASKRTLRSHKMIKMIALYWYPGNTLERNESLLTP